MSRYYDDSNIHIGYEEINGYLFVHVTFTTFSKEILTKLKKVWWEFQARAYFDGYEEIFTYTQDDRIIKLVGGATEINDKELDRINYRMFKWELK